MKSARLGDISKFLSGGTPSRQHKEYWGGLIPWISGADISEQGTIAPRNFITDSGVRGSAVNVVPAGTLLLVTRTSIGKSVVTPFELAFSQDITAILPKHDVVNIDYLRFFLAFYSPKLKAASRGATIQGVNRKDVEAIQIPLPELSEQKRIAAILDEVEILRSKLRETLFLLDELETSLFETEFGSHKEYKKIRLIDVCRPKQWPVISIKELKEVGYTVYGANGPIGFFDSFTHKESTIAITCRGATCGTVNVTPPKAYINGNAMALDNLNSDLVSLEFLAASLKSRGFADVISGSAQPQITREGLSKVTISVPPLSEQIKFGEKSNKVKELRVAAIERGQVIDELVFSLQHQAFKGEL